MSLISKDQIDGLEVLRKLIMTGFTPPTRREMLLYCFQIAAVVLEQKRWPVQMQRRLHGMLEFFEAAVPEIRGMIPDDYGRLPGDNGYNTSFPPGQDPCSQMQNVSYSRQSQYGPNIHGQFGGRQFVNGSNTDEYGRQAGDPGYMTGLPPGHPALPTSHHPHNHGNQQFNGSPWPELPGGGHTQRYMAGLALSVAAARLAQQTALNSANLYNYANNNPVMHSDPSGLSPDQGVGVIVKCPPEVAIARMNLCAEIHRLYVHYINNGWTDVPKCCTGPKQFACLDEWCTGPGNVYCLRDNTGACQSPSPSCAFDLNTGGGMNPNMNVYLCIPAVSSSPCSVKPCNSYTGNILHEMMHICGSGQGGGSPDPDPAQNRAQCLCSNMSTKVY